MDECPICKKFSVFYDSGLKIHSCVRKDCTYQRKGGMESVITIVRDRYCRVQLGQENLASPEILEDHGAVMMK